MSNYNMTWISGVANPDEIERFLYKKMYYVKVEKMCSSQIEVTAKDENEAKQKAESLKYDMILNWR